MLQCDCDWPDLFVAECFTESLPSVGELML